MKFKDTKIGIVPSHWEVRPIKEITEIVTDYVANGSFASLAENVTYKDEEDVAVLIRLVDYNNDFQGKFVFIDEHAYQFLEKSKLFGGEIIISNVGANVGTVFRCPKLAYKMSLAPNSVMVKFKGNDDFYFHWLRGFNGQQMLKSIVTGSAQPKFNKTNFKEMLVPVPPIGEQNKIASILNTIDEKIEINKKINNNLLEQALTLYATQFSSLELNGCIGDYCSVKSGFAFKSSWWTNNGIRVIKIGSINQDNLNLLECSYVDEDKADKAKDFVVKAGDLLIAMTGATIGKFAMVPYSSEMLLVNQRVGKFFLGNNPVEKLPFIYCTLKQPEVYGEVVNRGQGSAQPNISASDIMSIPCVIPSKDAINDFNNTSQPLFDLIIRNQRENQDLFELRNALLPKLMSGELDVSNIEL